MQAWFLFPTTHGVLGRDLAAHGKLAAARGAGGGMLSAHSHFMLAPSFPQLGTEFPASGR